MRGVGKKTWRGRSPHLLCSAVASLCDSDKRQSLAYSTTGRVEEKGDSPIETLLEPFSLDGARLEDAPLPVLERIEPEPV